MTLNLAETSVPKSRPSVPYGANFGFWFFISKCEYSKSVVVTVWVPLCADTTMQNMMHTMTAVTTVVFTEVHGLR